LTDPFDGFSLFFLRDSRATIDVVQLLDDIQAKEAHPDYTPCQLLADSLRIAGSDLKYWEELAEQWGGALRSEDGYIMLTVPGTFADQVDVSLWNQVK
jgi:hypothetical protein